MRGFTPVLFGVLAACAAPPPPVAEVSREAREFRSSFGRGPRTWIGPEYWANRLQDWQVKGGRLECLQGVANKPMRTVHLITHRLGDKDGDLEMTVRTGVIDAANRFEGTAHNAATGFLVGAGGTTMDYQSALLIHHNPGPGGGLFAGIDGSGRVFIRDFETPLEFGGAAPPGAAFPADRKTPIFRGILDDVALTLNLQYRKGKYVLRLTAAEGGSGRKIGEASAELPPEKLRGNLALVSHPGGRQKSGRYWFRDWDPERRAFEKWAGATARFWFRDWKVSGTKLAEDRSRAVGPVLSTQYTLSRRTLTLTAQLFPVGKQESAVEFQVREGAGWKTVAKADPVIPGYTATFRVKDWDDSREHPYRVVAALRDGTSGSWSGTIRRDPGGKKDLVVAAFTGNMMVRGGYEYPLPYGIDVPFPPDVEGKPVTKGNTYLYTTRIYFPHLEVVRNVALQKPDLLFFSGDQVYEGNPTRAVERPIEEASLDYLYKWYLWCWTWRGLTRDIPTITIPDDHDVYQRNIWGDGGRVSPKGDLDGSYGGYFMDPGWINMIQRTQTSHLPELFDPKPAKNGIGVYFTSVVVGGVGFAVIEDRKFKSFPNVVKARMSRDSHITQHPYDIRKADVPGAALLGDRQLKFLNAFSKEWEGQKMKAVLSQTIFANLQILNPRKDGVPQKFDIPLDRDLDANGWPQTGRRKALHEMRRGFMVHIAGDQHLASTIHHGTDEWEDSCWSLCVPSVANYYARSWNPKYAPLDAKPGMPPYTGRYEDGFHNKLTVKAVANPDRDPKPGRYPDPMELHGEMPGYGIVRFDTQERTITMACWPRTVDPRIGAPYEGWPLTLRQEDNYARKAVAWLPTVRVSGGKDPVVQVIDEANGEVVYTLRIPGTEYRPKVFKQGTYTLKVDGRTFPGLRAGGRDAKVLQVRLDR